MRTLFLLGTELGLLQSTNGGRSWQPEAPGAIVGPVFALAFMGNGDDAICAGRGGAFRLHDGAWTPVPLPADALPVRAMLPEPATGRVFLLGRNRPYLSSDNGQSYRATGADLPEAAEMTALALVHAPGPVLVAVVDGALMASADLGRTWQGRSLGVGSPKVEAIAADPAVPARVWAAGSGQVWRSDDAGGSWGDVGFAAPEAHGVARGIAADQQGQTIVLATYQGIYRSEDGGRSWASKEGILPVHLEAGPFFRDPADSRVLYAVFSLLPYGEVWRVAVQGSPMRSGFDWRTIAASLLFLAVLTGGGAWLVRALSRRRAAPAPARLASR